ncbi:hypothetical protein [Rubellimicrobium aerolatum]|uniref:Uncharacterized protein n=1 Tax=Rubellimicrobium aerolatum TaxID=490979 RepID=A0ABW0S8X1_9RHOB|nr:hypothetical protein [Rubellimicrobium aerolatum]MBP1804729.1 Na+/proline symporter [Rubellimicrobium aerolatum]
MSRNAILGIVIGIVVVVVLWLIFFATGGPEAVTEGNPAEANSTAPVTPGDADDEGDGDSGEAAED